MSLHNRGSLEPWIKDDVTFYTHQVEGVKHLKKLKSFLLADDMGLGKSLQTLAVFGMMLWEYNKKYQKSARMLVVVPVNLKDNWENEVGKFTRMNYIKLDGTPKVRKQQLEEFAEMPDPKILIVNYEQVEPHLAELNRLNFDAIAADEAHYLKNPKAKRSKAFAQLRAQRKFMLTGSPLLNNVHELWFLLDQISPGQWGTYWQFCQKYCVYGGFKNKQIVGVKNEQELVRKLNQVMLRRLKEDVLDLPPVVYTTRLVDLTPLQRKLYNEVVDTMELDDGSGDKPQAIDNALVKFLRLKQICGTTATVLADGTDESAKLDRALEDAIEIVSNGNKLVVFTQFRGVLEAYRRRLEEEFSDPKKYPGGVPIYEIHGGVKKELRQPIIDKWSAHEGPAIVLGIIKVIGVGLNMTAARYGQFIDKEFTPMLNKQAVDRMNRIGASLVHSVNILDYQCKNTAEARVEAILRSKKRTNDSIIENNDADFNKKLMAALKQRA